MKIIEEIAISGGRVKLTEYSLSKILTKHNDNGYVILSACKSLITKDGYDVQIIDNTMYKVKSGIVTTEIVKDEDLLTGNELIRENNTRTNKLKNLIISKNYSFLPVLGGYKYDDTGEESYEKSFIIFANDRKGNKIEFSNLEKDAIKFGIEFWQESILINRPGERPFYYNIYTKDTDIVFDSDVTNWKINDITQQYFTALKRGGNQRFTMECYTCSQPQNIMSSHKRSLLGEICMPLSYWMKFNNKKG